MNRRRNHRPRSHWNWAISFALTMVDNGTTSNALNTIALLPPPRVDWLLESGRGRSHLVVTGILMWLDCWILNPSASAQTMVNELNFWVTKVKTDVTSAVPGATDFLQPYSAPSPPASVLSWTTESTDENDGLDPFLWTHFLNPQNQERSYGSNGGYSPGIVGTNPNQNIIPMHPVAVRAGWQPDVHIKTKRKLVKGEGLSFGFGTPAGNGNGLEYICQVRARVLTT